MDHVRLPSGSSRRSQDSIKPIASPTSLVVSGAPVENDSPLGRNIGFFSAASINLSRMLGMGIYSTPGVVLDSAGSVGMSLILWTLGSLLAFAGLDLYNELAFMFPKRSGADVVFLEQAYPRPRLFLPTLYALLTVLLSISALSATVFAQYALYALDIAITPLRQRLLAVAMMTFITAICGISTRWSLRIMNVLAFAKAAQVLLVIYTGFSVFTGFIPVENSGENFHNIFNGTSWGGNTIATSLLKIDYTYGGWSGVIILLAEVQGYDTASHITPGRGPHRSPAQTIQFAGYAALSTASIIILFVNLSFFATVPKEVLRKSGSLASAIFFETAYGKGSSIATKVFPVLIAFSCVGGTVSYNLGLARMIREVGRQGILPYPEFWSATYPFGTPLAPILLIYILSILAIVTPPAEDAFNFLLDVSSYPKLIFSALVAVGVWILRRLHHQQGLARTTYRALNLSVVVYLFKSVVTLILPWIPPAKGSRSGDVGMWYATYCVVGILAILLCSAFYYVRMVLLPRIGGYVLVDEVVELPGGGLTNKLVRQNIPGKERTGSFGGLKRRPAGRGDEEVPLLGSVE